MAYIVIKYIDASYPLHMNVHIHISISSENHFKQDIRVSYFLSGLN